MHDEGKHTNGRMLAGFLERIGLVIGTFRKQRLFRPRKREDLAIPVDLIHLKRIGTRNLSDVKPIGSMYGIFTYIR